MRIDAGPGQSDETGAVAVVSAITLTVLLLFAAFVIDLGFLRADRAAGQSVADMAAAAAVQEYDPRVAGRALDACEEAVSYATANLLRLPQVTTPLQAATGSACVDLFPSDEICDASVVKTAVYTTGEFTVSITNPVLDSSDLMQGVLYDPQIDGSPCDRFGVEVHRTRGFHLAAAGGSDRTSGQTTMSAVARALAFGETGELSSLIILHRQHCLTVVASGSGPQDARIEVEGITRTETDENGDPIDVYYPGIITVDSLDTGSCDGNSAIMRTTGGARIEADEIYSFQLRQDPVNTGIVYNPSDNITETPVPGPRITRAPVDHRFNCRSTYPSTERWSPSHSESVSESGSCDEAGEIPPYITELHAAYQGMTAASAAADGWAVIPDTNATCNNVDGDFGPATAPPGTTGRLWYIDCTGPNGFRPRNVHFDGVDAIVTRHAIDFNSTGGFFEITGSADKGAVVYIQESNLAIGANSSTEFQDTFVYIHNGRLNVTGQAAISWSAPLGATRDSCVDYDDTYDPAVGGAPPAGCFSPLALWSNRRLVHNLGGGGLVVLRGSFFTPNSNPFSLSGGPLSDYTDAQFFAGRLQVDGGAVVKMIPNPDTNVEIPLTGRGLIR